MKIRAGFVSNSSSSSFVVVLPQNFLESIDYEKITDGDEDFPLEDFKKLLTDFVNDSGMWDEEVYNYDKHGDYEFMDKLRELIDPYVIASFDTSSDSGQVVVADRDEVIKILGL